MSNEKNETTGGEHNAEEKPIKIEKDTDTHIVLPTNFGELNVGVNLDESIEEGTIEIHDKEYYELSLSEALRVIEATVKFLNQTKNEGRQEIRTNKDKENQNTVDRMKKRHDELTSRLDQLLKEGLDHSNNNEMILRKQNITDTNFVKAQVLCLEEIMKSLGKNIRD